MKKETTQERFYKRMDRQLGFIKAWLERIDAKLGNDLDKEKEEEE